jgi:hypothetical protein
VIGLSETGLFNGFLPSFRLGLVRPLPPDFCLSLSLSFLGFWSPEGIEESLSVLMG